MVRISNSARNSAERKRSKRAMGVAMLGHAMIAHRFKKIQLRKLSMMRSAVFLFNILTKLLFRLIIYLLHKLILFTRYRRAVSTFGKNACSFRHTLLSCVENLCSNNGSYAFFGVQLRLHTFLFQKGNISGKISFSCKINCIFSARSAIDLNIYKAFCLLKKRLCFPLCMSMGMRSVRMMLLA